MLLYTFYRSTAAYRIRIALNYKRIAYEMVSINLLNNEQRQTKYKLQNPQGRVPLLIDSDVKIGQSAAILEYLEEKYPSPALLPVDIKTRAWVRYLSQIVISDMHPVMNNSSVVAYLRSERGFTDCHVQEWYFHWLQQGFDALENNLKSHKNCKNFCYGDTPTIADIALIPQVYNAHKFSFSMEPYPTLQRIYEHCATLDYFDHAKPENQLDYLDGSSMTGFLTRQPT